MLHIIYPYRNREEERVKRSLDSLSAQTNTNFKVYFVDYGSKTQRAKSVEALVATYTFAKYQYHPTSLQPWNKSRALNHVIKQLHDGFCFVADIDMIFHNEFVERAISLQKEDTAVYFKVGFLDEAETKKEKPYEHYKIHFLSTNEATGLTMFPVEALHEIRGFDEFYHFWGSEDTDVHIRLKNNGKTVTFYDAETLMLHQWHPSYRSKETGVLTKNLQITDIVPLNYQHLKHAIAKGVTSVNPEEWGEIMEETTATLLTETFKEPLVLSNRKEEVAHVLHAVLAEKWQGVRSFKISPDDFQNTSKYRIKKLLGKKVPNYYSMRDVNDMLLLHIITYYRNYPYIYQVLEDKNTIEFALLK